jgi:hypothetical protein
MKKLLTLLAFIFCSFLFGQNTSVLFGERKLADPDLAIFFDKEGTLYPNSQILDSKLISNNGSLKEFYKNNKAEFISISKNYGLDFQENTDDNIIQLIAAVSSDEIKKLNSAIIDGKSITFLIHGFRKPLNPINGDTSSKVDFVTMRQSMQSINTVFVNVYWDSNYDCCFSKKGFLNGKNKKIFKLFEDAQINAEKVGNSLKNILSNINNNIINVVTHSLGARVALYSLFNVDNSNNKTCSANEVNVLLIAPAISADLIFDNFKKRNSKLDYLAKDNYKITIDYNENDIVLLKKYKGFGPGPYKHGNTSLGCNYDNVAITLETKMKKNYFHSVFILKNYSNKVFSHLVRSYFKSVFFDGDLNGILK